jgi:hypothetical protein
VGTGGLPVGVVTVSALAPGRLIAAYAAIVAIAIILAPAPARPLDFPFSCFTFNGFLSVRYPIN